MIGDDDLATPKWASVNQQVATAGWRRTMSSVPSAVVTVIRLAWGTSRAWTAFAAVAQIVCGGVRAVGLYAMVDVLDHLLNGGPPSARIAASLPALALVVAAHATRAGAEAAANLAQAALAPQVEYAARHELYGGVLSAPAKSFADPDFTELVREGGMHGVWAVRRSVQAITDLLSGLVSLTVALVVVATFHPWLLPALLAAAAANGWAAMRAAKLRYDSFLRMVAHDRQVWVVGDLITDPETALEIRAFLLDQVLLDEHRRIATRLNREAVRVETRGTGVRLVGRTVAGVGSAMAFLTLGLLLYTERVPLALGGAAVVAMGVAAAALSQVAHEFNAMYENSFYIDLRAQLLAECRARGGPVRMVPVPVDPSVIRLDNVSFTYPGQPSSAVREIDLVIRRGQVVALVGENGSGKSTLGRLISGLHPPDEGRVLWDEVNLAGALPARVSLIGQDPVRWPVTAADNIRVGDLERDGARWTSSARAAGADTVIDALPEKEKTVLSVLFNRGRGLSTGQWQRMAVARGDYRDAPVLVADEPTSALDAEAEARVFAALRDRSRTTVLVTHRLVNVRTADLIVVLDRGRIAEQGTHDELIEHGGIYARLYALQAGAYMVDSHDR